MPPKRHTHSEKKNYWKCKWPSRRRLRSCQKRSHHDRRTGAGNWRLCNLIPEKMRLALRKCVNSIVQHQWLWNTDSEHFGTAYDTWDQRRRVPPHQKKNTPPFQTQGEVEAQTTLAVRNEKYRKLPFSDIRDSKSRNPSQNNLRTWG